MNAAIDYNAMEEVMGIIIERGFEGMDQAMSILINEAMKVERSKVLRADPYERTAERTGHGNGYKSKDVKSRLGNLSLQIARHATPISQALMKSITHAARL